MVVNTINYVTSMANNITTDFVSTLGSTIKEKSPWNAWHTLSKFRAEFLMFMEMTYIVFGKKHDIYNNDLPFPSPHQAMLEHIGEPLKTLAFLNIARGRGGDSFPLFTRKRSKTFFVDCLYRMQNISSKFRFCLITQKRNVACASYFTQFGSGL